MIRAGLTAVLVASGASGVVLGAGLPGDVRQARSTQGGRAQADVRAYAKPDAVSAGGRVVLVVEVVPRPRMRVYAPGAKGYRTAAVTVTPQPGLQIARTRYPRSQTYHFRPLDERVPVFDQAFVLTREVTVGARAVSAASAASAARVARGAGRLTIAGAFEYQACDDAVCYNPVTVPLEWSIGVGLAAARPPRPAPVAR